MVESSNQEPIIPDKIADYRLLVEEEYETESLELVGEPLTTDDGGQIFLFESPKDGEVFVIRNSPQGQHTARHELKAIKELGGNDYRNGVIKAIGIYAAADYSKEQTWDDVTDLVNGEPQTL